MSKIKLLMTATCIAFLVACSENGGPEAPESGSEGNFSLVAQMGEITKTELCACKEINWLPGDAISIWEKDNAGNSNVQFDLISASEGTSTGKFSGTLTPAGSEFTLYSVYPYNSSYGSDPTAISLTIPAAINQMTDINDIIGTTDFMVGRSDDTQYDDVTNSYKMLFQHPLAFVQFKIDARDCIYRQATLQTLTMTADVPFVGDVTLNCETGAITSAATGDDGKTLVISFPGTAALADVQTAWAAINPVDLTAANCKFVMEMTNGQKVTFTVNPKTMNAQSMYTFEFSGIDAKIASGKGVPTYVDLVAKAGGLRANCYIVHEGGYYRFAAQRVDKSNVFTGSQPYTDGYTADWLWASTAGKVSGVNIGNSGNINFKVEPDSECNAVIGLRDPSDNIIWSWHIWCTAVDPLTPNHYSRNNAWLLANRNLGALSDTDPGLYYQWGRKDPFPAVAESVTCNTDVAISGYSSKQTDVTSGAVAYSVAHPTTLLYANNYHTWISSEADANNAQSLWYTGTSRTNKTNYDPCPPGYLVPVANDYAWQNYFINDRMTYASGYVTYEDPASVTTCYPAGGYLNGLTLTDSGSTVRCWAANINGTPSATANLQARSLQITLSSQTVTTNQSSRTAFGLNVRCMKI